MLALDWRKAFDSINVEALLHTLCRFGLPDKFIDAVKAIYTDRTFIVIDGGISSGLRSQRSGIYHGVHALALSFHSGHDDINGRCMQLSISRSKRGTWDGQIILYIVCRRYLCCWEFLQTGSKSSPEQWNPLEPCIG